MAGFNPMEGYTVAKNPWRNTSYGKGTHYFKTAFPQTTESQDQKRQREKFKDARDVAERECNDKDGMTRSTCIAEKMSDELSDERS